MWKMTLKQRRRHSELMKELDKLKRDPYLMVPESYTFGEDLEEDEKYQTVLASFKSVVEEINNIEVAAREAE
jgi:hypothetical protein